MRHWIRRNGLAVLIIGVIVVLVGVTVTRPTWRREIGSKQPQQTVRYGQSAVIDGVRWQLISIQPPGVDLLKKRELLPGEVDKYPANGRLVPFVFLREGSDERPARPPGTLSCLLSAVDGHRRWGAQTMPVGVSTWANRAGYATYCEARGPLLVGLFVPITAHITAIDVKLSRITPDDGGQPPQALDLWVIRFDTG
jgi:hypothetical protein